MRRYSRQPSPRNCFNGAAILRSRKCDQLGVGSVRESASMGPRSYDRGNTDYPPKDYSPSPASMGPLRDDPGNLLSLPATTPSLPLQWGRDLTIAEMGGNGQGQSPQRPASMGPRSYDRGNRTRGGELYKQSKRFNGAAILRSR